MSKTAFVLGNGESRRGIKIADLKLHGKVWACNGVYRTEEPDVLIAVDPKMILEIAETEYPVTHEVWSNYNHQYDRVDRAKNHIQFFRPSLGWSSGPTALKHACDQGFKEIYILGFDYQGHLRSGTRDRFSFNNVFKGTRNYKPVEADATFSDIGGDIFFNGKNVASTLDYSGTIRGRIGVLVTPSALLYATGGAAISE